MDGYTHGHHEVILGPTAEDIREDGAVGTDEAQQVLDDLKRRATNEPVSSHDVAVLYAALGDHEQAFEWLGRACDEHSEHVPYAGVNPRLDALRSDARFAAVLERLNLSE